MKVKDIENGFKAYTCTSTEANTRMYVCISMGQAVDAYGNDCFMDEGVAPSNVFVRRMEPGEEIPDNVPTLFDGMYITKD